MTAKAGVLDKVHGLRRGAEDYITKPLDLLEVLARVEVALRRVAHNKAEVLTIGDVRVDCTSHKVFKAGKLITFTFQL